MKTILILAVVALLVIAAVLYFGGGTPDLTVTAKNPSPPAAAPPAQDFHAVTAVLEKELGSVPTTLEAPGITPANAFTIKSRLAAAPDPRPEYQTLAHACELIIYADQEHAVRRRRDQEEQVTAGAARAPLHARAQADWDRYRQQSDAEVRRLLASLQNAKL